MRKNNYLSVLLTAVCFFSLLGRIDGQPTQTEFANYITISNGEFRDGNSVFKPLCINYLVQYLYDKSIPNNPVYYVAPLLGYSSIKRHHLETWFNISPVSEDEHWGYGDDGATERDSAGIKLEHDLKVIDSLGFNVVRLRPAIQWDYDILRIPTGSYSEYFRLTDSLIAKCAKHNLRVIMVLGDKKQCYTQFDQYYVYLDSVTRHYSNNKTVMAYVVYMEPGYKWENSHENDKLLISNWSRKWYYLIKKNAPNQLVTYGLGDPKDVLFWDLSALTYDFLSMHFYHITSSVDSSKTGVECYFKWMHDNVSDVWVLGETGFSATADSCLADPQVGTEAEQYEYVDYTMRKSLNCGCKGYSWWQYQEVHWKNCRENHFGIVPYYPGEQPLKMSHSLFPTYRFRIPQGRCLRPTQYYNMGGFTHVNFHGTVTDQDSNPIKDAVVVAWDTNYEQQYSTFTDSQGEYTIHTPPGTVVSLVWVSHNGYTDKSFFHVNNAVEATTLTRINYNGWKKNWTNQNYRIPGDTLVFENLTKTVIGNFCGDEAQEMFVMNPFSNRATLYRYDINHWERLWEGALGDWQISSTDRYFAGDFNGNGYEDILCVRDSSGSLACIYSYDPSIPHTPWLFVWTNNRNGKIGNWTYSPGDVILPGCFTNSNYCSLMCIRKVGKQKNALCQRLSAGSWVSLWTASTVGNDTYIGSWVIGGIDKYYVGDFSGDGIDELFCVQVTDGTSDKMTLIQYNTSWSMLWSNYGISEGVGIYPYRANLHVGNFDVDCADEILGFGTWATKFDLSTSNQWNWSWSTYDSGKLSDWSVNPNHRIFFMKVMADVPDYLFVSQGIPRINYRFDAYSFDP